MVIDGFKEAVEAENGNRDEAWLNLPDVICGLPVNQLTPYHLLLLDGAANCFVSGGAITPEGVAQFLWILSPAFSYEAEERNAFLKKAGLISYKEAVGQIEAFLSKTFQDAPATGGSNEKPIASFVAYYVYILGSEFGWSAGTIINTPLRQIYQLLDIRNSKLMGAEFVKTRPSDKLIRNYLKSKKN